MRILSLYYTHKPGGFCKRLYRLLGALAQRGHEVHYLSLDQERPNLLPAVQWHRISFPLRSREGFFFWALFTIYVPWAAVSAARRFNPERAVVFGSYYAVALWLAKKLWHIPLILFLRLGIKPSDHPSLLGRLQLSFDHAGIGFADRIVCMSQTMRSEVEACFPGSAGKIEILPNDITAKPASDSPKGGVKSDLIAICTGYLVRRKNVEFLLKAFARLREISPQSEWKLWIIGSGPDLSRLKSIARQESLESVAFMGWQEDVSPYLAKASVLLHASCREGMPNSVLEALAWDVPVLGSKVPEMEELLSDRDLLFELGDTKELALKLVEAEKDRAVIERWRGLCAKRRTIFQFDWDSKAVNYSTA